MSHVPVINIKKSPASGQEIVEAFRAVGFAYLEGHGVDQEPISPDLLSHFEKPLRVSKRWDNLELHSLAEDSTYGDFVWKKISKVFPNLADGQ